MRRPNGINWATVAVTVILTLCVLWGLLWVVLQFIQGVGVQ